MMYRVHARFSECIAKGKARDKELDKKERESLERGARDAFCDGYSILKKARRRKVRSPKELVVLAAEAAVVVNDFEKAEEALAMIFLEDKNNQDQFTIRAMLVKAQLSTEPAESILLVTSALKIARAQSPRYDFLVYNAIILMWPTIRKLLVKTDFVTALEPLQAAFDALLHLKDDADLIAFYGRALAYTLDNTNDATAAAKTLSIATSFDQRISHAKSIAHCRLSALSLSRRRSETKKVCDSIVAQLPSHSTLLSARAGAFFTPCSKTIPLTQVLAEIESTSILSAETGSIAYSIFENAQEEDTKLKSCQLALKCAQQDKSADPVSRIRMDFLIHSLSAQSLPLDDTTFQMCNSDIQSMRLTKRLTALRQFEFALKAAQRLDDPALIQEGCVALWNAALPLLEKHLRKHTTKPFKLAALLLDTIDSPLLQFRARLHFEIALSELDENFISKAKRELKLALQHEQSEINRFAEPLLKRLDLRSTLDDEIDSSSLDKAEILLDNALGTTSSQIQWIMLTKVQQILTDKNEIASVPEPKNGWKALLKNTLDIHASLISSDPSHLSEENTEIRFGTPRASLAFAEYNDICKPSILEEDIQISKLWGRLIDCAWLQHRAKACLLVQIGAPIVLRNKWPTNAHKDLLTLQVRAQYALAESWIDELKRLYDNAFIQLDISTSEAPPTWLELGVDCNKYPFKLNRDASSDDIVEVRPPACLNAFKVLILKALVTAVERAFHLGDSRLVLNGAIQFWNYHMHITRSRRYDVVLDALIDAATSIKARVDQLAISLSNSADISTRLTELVVQCKLQRVKDLSSDKAAVKQVAILRKEAVDICESTIRAYGRRPFLVKLLVELHYGLTNKVIALTSVKYNGVLFNIPINQTQTDQFNHFINMTCMLCDLTHQDPKGRSEHVTTMITALEQETIAPEGLMMEPVAREDDEEILALRCELWARLSVICLESGLDSSVQLCASRCCSLLPEPSKPKNEFFFKELDASDLFMQRRRLDSIHSAVEYVTSYSWRWANTAEIAAGRSIQASITVGQDKADQDRLYAMSLLRFVRAARYAVAASEWPDLCTDAARYFWNSAMPLSGALVSRRLCKVPLLCILACLDGFLEKDSTRLFDSIDVRTNLLKLLIACYADNNEWENALKVTDDALAQIAKALNDYHKNMDDSHEGGPAEDDELLDDDDGETISVAPRPDIAAGALRKSLLEWRVSLLSRLGRSAATQVVAQLRNEKDPLTCARVWTTLARNSANRSQQLLAYKRALDAVNDRFEKVEYLVEFAEWMLNSGMKHTDVRTTLRLAVDTLLKVDKGLFSAAINDTISLQSSNRLGGSCADSETISVQSGSVKSFRMDRTARSSASSRKSSLSAVPRSPKELRANHLELLLRAVSMLAQLATTFDEKRRWLLLGHHYAQVLVNKGIQTANAAAVREMDKQAKTLTQAKAKVNKPPYIQIESLVDWCASKDEIISESCLNHMRQPPHRRRRDVLSKNTCSRAELSAHYICTLADGLLDAGLEAYALAPLAVLELIGALVLPDGPLQQYARLRRVRILLGAGVISRNDVSENLCDSITEKAIASVSDASDVNRIFEQRENNLEKKAISNFGTRHIWIAIAGELVALDHPASASTYLVAARRHNDAFNDKLASYKCAEVAAELAAVRGNLNEAKSLILAAQKYDAVLPVSARTTLLHASYCLEANDRAAAKVILKKGMTRLIDAEPSLKATRPTVCVDTLIAWAQFELLDARIDAAASIEQLRATIKRGECPDCFASSWSDARDRIAVVAEKLQASARPQPEMDNSDLPLHPVEIMAAALVARLDLDGICFKAIATGVEINAHEFASVVRCLEESVLSRARSLLSVAWPASIKEQISCLASQVARIVCSITTAAAFARKELARHVGEIRSHAAVNGDIVAQWLKATRPLKFEESDVRVSNSERAVLHASTSQVLAATLSSRALAHTALGSSLACLISLDRNKNDDEGKTPAKIQDVFDASIRALRVHIENDRPLQIIVPESSDSWHSCPRQLTIESLDRALSLGLAKGDVRVAASASQSLITDVLSDDLTEDAIYCVLLHQSCVARAYMENVLLNAVRRRPQSHFANLMRQKERTCRSTNESLDLCFDLQEALTTAGQIVDREGTSAVAPAFCFGGGLLHAASPQRLSLLESDDSVEHVVAWENLKIETPIVQCIAELEGIDILSFTLVSGALYLLAICCGVHSETSVAKAPIIVRQIVSVADLMEINELDRGFTSWRLDATRNRNCRESGDFTGEEEDALDDAYTELVQRVKKLWTPILSETKMKEFIDTRDRERHLCVLLDPKLQFFPIEAVLPEIDSRDLSIHALHRRITSHTDKLELSKLAVVVDPPSEDDDSLEAITDSLKQLSSKQISTNNPSALEIQNLVSAREKNSGYLMYCAGRASMQLPPEAIASLDASGMQLIFIVDRADSDNTQRRQAKLESKMMSVDLMLREPLEMLTLWSLVGGGSILMNRWQTSLSANQLMLTSIVERLQLGVPLAKALRTFRATSSADSSSVLKNRIRDNPILFGLPTLRTGT